MSATEFKVQIEEESVKPNDLEILPLPFKSGPVEATFNGVFGKSEKGGRIWLATFYDNDEAAAWIQASKTFGRPVRGASIPTQQEVLDGARIPSGDEAPQGD